MAWVHKTCVGVGLNGYSRLLNSYGRVSGQCCRSIQNWSTIAHISLDDVRSFLLYCVIFLFILFEIIWNFFIKRLLFALSRLDVLFIKNFGDCLRRSMIDEITFFHFVCSCFHSKRPIIFV